MSNLRHRLNAIEKHMRRSGEGRHTPDLISAYLHSETEEEWAAAVATVPPDNPMRLLLEDLRRNRVHDPDEQDDLEPWERP
jgi:hypothetical protein